MRGLGNMYHHSCIIFFVVLLVRLVFSISTNTLTSAESLTVSSNRTIVSPNGVVFELGFFQTGSNSRWYLGIWYKNEPQRTIVWVANRDQPLCNSIGTLKISDANLVLLDQCNIIVWSTNRVGNIRSSLVGELLDNGNFVLRKSDNNICQDGYLWQSFDFPTDTSLLRMKLGSDRIYSRLSLSSTGRLGLYTMTPPSSEWNLVWFAPKDECDMYKRCGPNSYCNINTSPVCNCIKGFDPKDPQEWRLSNWVGGCVRRTRLRCNKDGFLQLKKIKLPVITDVIVLRRISTEECKERCLGDCNCTAFANPYINGELCDLARRAHEYANV